MIAKFLSSRAFVGLEFLLLCLVVPGWIIYSKSAAFMFAFLWGACLYCALIYMICLKNGAGGLWRFDAVTLRAMKPLLLRWVLASIGMLGFMIWYDPARLFFLPLQRPSFVPTLMIAYPLISALPQEFIFCSFFFRRYKRFFGSGRVMILASAITFAYAHVLYINPIAPFFGFVGGLIFATTYARSKSLALVTIEHGLYGNVLFIIGLGWYFYSGAVH